MKSRGIGEFDLYKHGVTQSVLSTWMSCRVRAQMSLSGWTSIRVGTPLTFGSVAHSVLDYTYTHLRVEGQFPDDDKFQSYVDKAEAAWMAEHPAPDKASMEALELSLGFAEAVLPAYIDYWEDKDHNRKWVEIEGAFSVPVSVPASKGQFFNVRGRRDAAYKKKGLWLFETKTKGQWNEGALVDRLALDFQCNVYLWALWKETGKFPKGILYNLIRRPQLRRKQKETLGQFVTRCRLDVKKRPDFYFTRLELAMDPADILEFDQEFTLLLNEFAGWYEGTLAHYANTTQCEARYGTCGYLPVCIANDFRGLKKRTEIHPELEDRSV